jgi:hypothetical protein
MPTELLQPLGAPEGEKLLRELCPDIVSVYFKALYKPARVKKVSFPLIGSIVGRKG